MKSEIKENVQGTNREGWKPRHKSMIWNKRKKKVSNWNRMKKQECKKKKKRVEAQEPLGEH